MAKTLDEQILEEYPDLPQAYRDLILLRRERANRRYGAPSEPAPPPPSTGEKAGAIGARLAEAGLRFLKGATGPGRELAKLPGSVAEWMGASPTEHPVPFRLKAATQRLEGDLEHQIRSLQAKADTTGEATIPGWVPEMAGSFLIPAPALKPIPKLLSREAIKPALAGMAKMGAYSGGLSALSEVNKAPEHRDWSQVPTNAAIGVAAAPIMQRLMGAFATPSARKPSVDPNETLRQPPQPEPTPEPTLRPSPTSLPLSSLTPAGREVGKGRPDYVDADWRYVRDPAPLPPGAVPPPVTAREQPPQLPHDPRLQPDPMPMPGPIKPGPGTVIHMPDQSVSPAALPAPPWSKPLPTEDVLAKMRPATPWRDVVADLPNTLPVKHQPPYLIKHPEARTPLYTEAPPVDTPAPVTPAPAPVTPPPLTTGKVYGPTLAEFLAEKGGVLDQGGEIGRLEMPRKPFKKALIKKQGMTLDDAAELAHEAGYLSDRDINQLLAALEQESRGKPVYAPERTQAPLADDLIAQEWDRHTQSKPIDPAEAEWALTPDEPIHPSDLPDDVLPPLEESWPSPHEMSAPPTDPAARPGELFAVPPETIGSRPIIGREVTPEEAPLFSKAAQMPEPHQTSLAPEHAVPVDPDVLTSAAQETSHLQSMMDGVSKLFKDERGSITLGKDLGPLERTIILPQRLAEKYPAFQPVFDLMTKKTDYVHGLQYDWKQMGKAFFELPMEEQRKVWRLLVERRMTQGKTPIPQEYQPAVTAVDDMMDTVFTNRNALLHANGLPPVAREPFYVPFMRPGNYLTIGKDATTGKPAYVSAFDTIREAERDLAQKAAQYPNLKFDARQIFAKGGDDAPISLETLAELRKAGFINQAEFTRILAQFDIPPGHAGHFLQASRMAGASTDPAVLERYLNSAAEYMGKYQFNRQIHDEIEMMPKGGIQDYARKLQKYIEDKPQEFSRARGLMARFALAGNVKAMLQNLTQVRVLGTPILQRHLGSLAEANRALSWANQQMKHPTPAAAAVLKEAERVGELAPVNTLELFGQGDVRPAGVQMGAPTVEQWRAGGTISGATADRLRGVADALADRAERAYQGLQAVDMKVGKALGLKTDATMGAYAKIEARNRQQAVLAGLYAAEQKGLSGQAATQFALDVSREINFLYTPVNRPPIFRGKLAPLGMFMTFPTQQLSTYRKLLTENVGTAATAASLYWAFGGLRGVPGLDLLNKTGAAPLGLKPGWIQDSRGDDWTDKVGETAWYGPASKIFDTSVGPMFQMGPQAPVDLDTGKLDLAKLPFIRPWAQGIEGVKMIAADPKWTTVEQALEQGLPPVLSAPLTAGRWAAESQVGTRKGSPFIGRDGKPAFYQPSAVDLIGKALGFNPQGLQESRDRAEIDARTAKGYRAEIDPMRDAFADELTRNGTAITGPAGKDLQRLHPEVYKHTLKAYQNWLKSGRHGTIQQYYRLQEAEQKTKALTKAKAKHGD